MATKTINLSAEGREEKKALIDKFDTFFFDMDGTLVELGNGPLEGANEVLTELNRRGKTIKIYTDNDLTTREAISNTLRRYFPVIKDENVISMSVVIADYFKKIGFTKKIYVIGPKNGLIQDLEEDNFNVVYDDRMEECDVWDLPRVKLEEGVGAVLVATDSRFNYLKLFKAIAYLKDPHCLFVAATHLPYVIARVKIPVTGTITAAITASTRRDPILIGKGSQYSAEFTQSLGIDMKKSIFIGDLLSTDIAAGNMSGMSTLVVLSQGYTTLHHIQKAEDEGRTHHLPTYIANSVGDLLHCF